jgi:proline iminopeptidase
VKALILRGIFTLRRSEVLWFYQEGASWLFPDAWEKYLEPIPGISLYMHIRITDNTSVTTEVERGDLMSAYLGRLTSPDLEEQYKAAKAWTCVPSLFFFFFF